VKIDKNTYLRDLVPSDRKSFLKLKLKQGDAEEIYNMIGEDYSKYLEWHFDNHMSITRGIFYKGKLFGFICISDEGNLSFLTAKLEAGMQYAMVRYFKKVLLDEMERRNVDRVDVVIDSTYTTAIKWAKHGGFIFNDFIDDTVHPLEVLTYWRQFVAN